MSPTPKIYLAGPEVFLPDAVALGERKKDLCRCHGFEGLFPFDNEAVPVDGGPGLGTLIYRGNVAMMRAADCAVLNLSPFRGAAADTGTSFELGFLSALGKPCVGYANGPADYIDRVRALGPVTRDEATGYWRDADGLAVEDFGNSENLMLDEALAELGAPGGIRGVVRAGSDRPLDDLGAFVECLLAMARLLGRSPA
jgi:nucleoside 2-deoxyribosyltransferase